MIRVDGVEYFTPLTGHLHASTFDQMHAQSPHGVLYIFSQPGFNVAVRKPCFGWPTFQGFRFFCGGSC